ncbi:MAG: hypothetical protein Q4C61_18005 [Lachnospiraceae bacterium]|nr:hypothetical protein [Lachnospiraceae bacterium]
MGNRVGDWGDVAPLVPLAFWLKAREEVAKVNPGCIWLSESVEPEFILDLRSRGMTNLSDSEIFQAFDMCYDYDIHKFFRQYLKGGGPAWPLHRRYQHAGIYLS